MADTKATGTEALLLSVLAIIEDVDPSAVSAETKSKVETYAGLVGGALDSVLSQVGTGDKIPTIIDASAKILEQIDVIYDVVKPATKTITASAPTQVVG